MKLIEVILVATVQVYRWLLSPAQMVIFGPTQGCRYAPSCSAYALEALRAYGPARGTWLAVKRVCRCHPWGGCGHDPVPENARFRNRDEPSLLRIGQPTNARPVSG